MSMGRNNFFFINFNITNCIDKRYVVFECIGKMYYNLNVIFLEFRTVIWDIFCVHKGPVPRQVTKSHLYHLLGVSDYYVMYRHRAQSVLQRSPAG